MNENEKDIQKTIDKFTTELYDSLGIAPEYFSDTSSAQIQHNYQQYQLCQILRPYERQIDVLNAQLLVATTLLRQISDDMEIVGDKLTEAAYNSTNPTCPMSERCDTCLFFIEALAGCYYKHLKEIKDFLKSLEDNSNA